VKRCCTVNYVTSDSLSVDTNHGLSANIAASHYASADPVLAASAILQQLVDSGVLERILLVLSPNRIKRPTLTHSF